MKTNFLCRQTIISLLLSSIFLMVNTYQAFSQVQWDVSINTNTNCSDGDLTHSNLVNSNATAYSSNFYDTNSSSCDDEAVLTRYDRKDLHVHIEQLVDTNNPLSATEELTSIIKNSIGNYVGSQGAPSVFMDVAFRFGVRTGSFSKSYSVRYYLEKIKSGSTWYYIYRKRLYYDKGYVDLLNNEVGIDFYVEFDDVGEGTYILTFNDIPLECGQILGADRIAIESFISTYNRPNDGGAQFLHQISAVSTMPNGCSTIFCENYPISQYGENHTTPACNVLRKTSCQGTIFAPWDPIGTFGGGNKVAPSGSGEVISIDVYPNPTDNRVNIALNTPDTAPVKLEIINSTGKLVYQQASQVNRGTNFIHVDVTTLPSGVYYVKIDSKYDFETQKFTILK